MTVNITYHGHACFTVSTEPEDAVKAVQFLQPKQGVLMHYNTFGLITQDAEAVARAIRQHTTSQPVLLRPGETLTLPR